MPRNLNGARREINSRAACAAARKLQKVCSHAAADFQEACAREIIEAHHLRHPGSIFLVTMSLDLIEKLARAEFMLAPVHSAARVLSPLLARALLLFLKSYGAICLHCAVHCL